MSVFQERLQQSLRNPELGEILRSRSECDEDGCLLWKGTIGTRGYGKYNSIEVHKLWYILHHGSVPQGRVLAHSCHKKLCLIHARPISQGANILETTSLITHCPYGHPYDEENTLPGRGRRCRTCNNDYAKKGTVWERRR